MPYTEVWSVPTTWVGEVLILTDIQGHLVGSCWTVGMEHAMFFVIFPYFNADY